MYSVKFKILNLFVVIMVGYIGLYLLSWVFVESFPGPSKYLPAFLPLRLPDSVSMDGCCIITNEEFLIQPEPSSVWADILRPLNSVSAGIPSLDQVITNLDFMFDAIIHGFYHMPASVAFVSWYIVLATIFGYTNWMVSLRRHRLTKHQLSYVRARSSVRYHPRYRPVPARQKPLTFRRWVVYLGIYLISGVPLGVWWTYGSSLQLQTLMSQSGAWTMPWLACHLSALPQRIISTAGMHRLSLQSLPIWQSLACLAATTSFFCGIIMSRSRRKKRKIHRFPVSYWRRNQVRVPINPTRCYASVFVHRILMYCSVLLRLCSASVSTSWSQLPGILRTSLDMTKDGLTYGLQYKSKILPFQRPMRWIPLTFSGLGRKLVYWRSCEEIKKDGIQTPTWMMTAKNWPAILLSLLRTQIGVSPISLWRSCWVILGSRIVRMGLPVLITSYVLPGISYVLLSFAAILLTLRGIRSISTLRYRYKFAHLRKTETKPRLLEYSDEELEDGDIVNEMTLRTRTQKKAKADVSSAKCLIIETAVDIRDMLVSILAAVHWVISQYWHGKKLNVDFHSDQPRSSVHYSTDLRKFPPGLTKHVFLPAAVSHGDWHRCTWQIGTMLTTGWPGQSRLSSRFAVNARQRVRQQRRSNQRARPWGMTSSPIHHAQPPWAHGENLREKGHRSEGTTTHNAGLLFKAHIDNVGSHQNIPPALTRTSLPIPHHRYESKLKSLPTGNRNLKEDFNRKPTGSQQRRSVVFADEGTLCQTAHIVNHHTETTIQHSLVIDSSVASPARGKPRMPIKGVLTKPHPRLCDAAALPDGDKQYGSSSEANRDAQLCRQKALDLEREIQVEWQNEHLNIKGLVDTEKRLLDYRQAEKQQDHMQAELLQGQMEMLRQQAEQEHGVSATELQHRAHLRQEAQLQLLANQQRLAELERQAELNLQAERQRQRLQCQAELHRQVALQQQAHIQRQTEPQQQAYIQWHAQVHRAEVERQQLLWQAQLRWQAEQAELERQALMQQQARLQWQAVNESQAWEAQRQEDASKQLAEAHRKAEEEAKFQAWVVEAQTRALEIAEEECRRNERLYQLNREREEQAICEGYPARPPVVKPPKTRNKNNNGKVCKKAQSGLRQTHSNDQAEPRAVQPYDHDQLETFNHGPSTPSKKCRPRKKNQGLPSLSKVMLSGKPRRR